MAFSASSSVDVGASLALLGLLTLVLGAYVVASLAAGRALVMSRVEREAPLPLVGKTPMHAVYRALVPIGRVLVALGISANAVSIAALVIAAFAGVAFATGHFGVAALIAAFASLADGLDGFVARLTNTKSRFGQVLDTTIDRYVDAFFLGGIAILVHHDVWLLSLCIAAIVGSFMVSYASSVERELEVEGQPASMRRAHRLVYLIAAATLAPLVGQVADGIPNAQLVPIFLAVGAIAIVGNVSAVRRLLAAGRTAKARDDERASGPDLVVEPAPLSESTHEAE